MSERLRDSCPRGLVVIAGLLAALGAGAPTASAALMPAAFGPPLAKFTQDMSRPTQTAVGDFDGDAKLDIVAVSLNGQPGDQLFDIALMKGDGFGNFGAATGVNTTDGLIRVVVGEFNGDSDPDLAASLSASGQLLIYTGAAGMTFAASPQNPISLSGVSTPFGIAVGQFNGDADADLAVADNAGSQVEILTGGAGASFSAQPPIAVAGGPIDIARGEFNGDSDPDLAVAHLGDDTITILTGATNATFAAGSSFDPGSSGNMWVGVADFNNDSDADLAIANATSDDVKIFQGGNGSTFLPVGTGGTFTVVGAGRGTIGDFNDDTDEDLAVPSTDNDEIRILLGATGSTFVANHRTRPSGDETNGLSNGLFDGDTRLDIVAANPGPASDNVVWHGSRPPEPVIGGTSPPSGTNDNTPEVFGEVATGSVVDIYKTSDCTGPVAVNNATKAQFTAGVTLPAVPDNSTTAIGAIAVEGTRQSTCSVPINYVEDSDFDNDGLIDEVDTDDDNDGVLDTTDNCDLAVNPGQLNTDGDALGDACDPDDDNDGAFDGADNCGLTANADQANADGDAAGDACDADDDNDGVLDVSDNCALVANGDQANGDGDAEGDACDSDHDGDGVADASDNCATTPNPDQADRNANGIGSACDPFELLPGRCANAKLGTPGAETLAGTVAGDRLTGLAGNDVLKGLAGRDCLVGGLGNDRLSGGDGDDTLKGGKGRDRLSGGRGNDFLSGGPGRNRYSGGAGKDRISARNGRAEKVRCGPGRDRAKVDAADRTVGCERVSRRSSTKK